MTVARNARANERVLNLVDTVCPACSSDVPCPVAIGEDFEYATSADTFLAVRCDTCGAVYLNPRPSGADFSTIYPDSYHAFDFKPEAFGLVHAVRRRLESLRLAQWIRGLPASATVLDVGCGDGFHLSILRELRPQWTFVGVEIDERAAARARARGFEICTNPIERAGLPAASVDLVLLVQTIEHVERPREVLAAIAAVLKPHGRLIVVTDNTASLDRVAFAGRHWGGYHFPRHLTLFDAPSLSRMAQACGLRESSIETMTSPVNWTYSIRNVLVDRKAPSWLFERFSLRSFVALSFFTVVDTVAMRFGRGALLHATFVPA